MSQVKVNSIVDASGGSNAVLYGVASPPNSMGFRNRILNGGMVIDQRNAGASVASNNYPVDRWLADSAIVGKYTAQQNSGSVTPPAGFTNYLGAVSQSAYTLVAGSYYTIQQYIEGYNVADLAWGTASAQAVTLSFWVRSSLTGTFGGSVKNSAENRSYPFTYTINAANTWEQKVVNIPGDTTGTWLTTNGKGISLFFGLGVGSTYSGTAGAWAAANYASATGAVSLVSTNAATWYITGVQLEAGTNASPFERRDYGRELILCQRYFARVFDPPMRGVGTGGTTGGASRLALFFPTTMRAQPTVSINGTFNFWNGSATATGTVLEAYFIGGYNGIDLDITTSASFTIGQAVCAYCTNNTTTKYVNLAAEL